MQTDIDCTNLSLNTVKFFLEVFDAIQKSIDYAYPNNQLSEGRCHGAFQSIQGKTGVARKFLECLNTTASVQESRETIYLALRPDGTVFFEGELEDFNKKTGQPGTLVALQSHCALMKYCLYARIAV